MTQAVPTVFIDNDRTRVTEWRFAPGAETGQHRHEYDYVIVPTFTGQLRITSSDGENAVRPHPRPSVLPTGGS